MAGGESNDIPKLTGIQKYFNSYTIKGRANVVGATYGFIFLTYLYFKLKPSSKDKSKN